MKPETLSALVIVFSVLFIVSAAQAAGIEKTKKPGTARERKETTLRGDLRLVRVLSARIRQQSLFGYCYISVRFFNILKKYRRLPRGVRRNSFQAGTRISTLRIALHRIEDDLLDNLKTLKRTRETLKAQPTPTQDFYGLKR